MLDMMCFMNAQVDKLELEHTHKIAQIDILTQGFLKLFEPSSAYEQARTSKHHLTNKTRSKNHRNTQQMELTA